MKWLQEVWETASSKRVVNRIFDPISFSMDISSLLAVKKVAFYGEGEGISMLMDIIPEPHDPSEASRMELEAIDYKF